MRQSNRIIFTLAAGLALLAIHAPEASAHIGFSRENVFSLGEEARQYKEGSTVFMDLSLPHACSDRSTNQSFATRGVRVLFPNAEAIPDTYTESKDGTRHGGNVMMSIRVRASGVWMMNPVQKSEVSPYFSHGLKTEDVRAIQWSQGRVDNDHYDRLEFRAKLPSIDPNSCLASIKVYVPAVQWCEGGHAIAWLGSDQTLWSQGEPRPRWRVETDYAPSFVIVRSSPLPTTCNEGGESIEVRPTVADYNRYVGPATSIRARVRRIFDFLRPFRT